MRHVVCWVVAPALLILLLAPQPADARIIYTAPIEDVLPHASHVIRAHWSKKHPLEFEVEQVFRGEGLKVGQTIVVHGLYLGHDPYRYRDKGFTPGYFGKKKKIQVKSVYLALYRMDGRWIRVGNRPSHNVPTHSSWWFLGEDDQVHGFRQVINPGQPVPMPLAEPARTSFELRLVDLLEKTRFEGYTHRPLPVKERDAFRKLTEPTIHWYERRLLRRELSSEDRVRAAKALAAYGQKASKQMAVHAFDAIGILAPTNYDARTHERACLDLLIDLVKTHGSEAFRPVIIETLAKGRYMRTNRSVMLGVAKRTDKKLYEEGVRILVELGTRQHYNEGLAAYYALLENGETGAASSVQIAQGWSDDD